MAIEPSNRVMLLIQGELCDYHRVHFLSRDLL